MQPIYEDEKLVAFRSDNESDTLVFAFNNIGVLANGTYVWGEHFLGNTGFNRIVFMAKAGNWFTTSSVMGVRAVAQDWISQHKRRVTVGNSMGGYAALKYAALLGADACLSFNPQYSIDPAMVWAFDRRFEQFFTPEMKGMEIVSADVPCSSYIFLDPAHRQDNGHAQIIAKIAGSQLIKVFYTGHVTIRPASTSPRMKRLIELALDCEAPVRSMASEFVRWRRTSPDYYRLFGDALKHRQRLVAAEHVYRLGCALPHLNKNDVAEFGARLGLTEPAGV